MRPHDNGLQQLKASKCIWLSKADTITVFQYSQVEESLNDMDFQLFLDLYFTDGDYT